MRFPEHQSLIMRTGYAPVKAEQFVWYKEKVMKNLSLPPLLIPTQCVQRPSFEKNYLFSLVGCVANDKLPSGNLRGYLFMIISAKAKSNAIRHVRAINHF